MLDGSLQVGSRTPVADVPAWATLEVATGGFATGALLAGGPLLTHERQALGDSPAIADEQARATLNASCLTDAGLARLQELLRSGCYDVDVPEEGALLVVAWLVEHGRVAEAQTLLDQIGPYFSRLRFYPQPSDAPRRSGPLVFVQDAANTLAQVRKVPLNHQVLAQREAVTVWTPLYDRIVALFLETVEGDDPTLLAATNGEAPASANAAPQVVGGWPCQVFPAGWQARAQATLAEMQTEREKHRRCGKLDKPKSGIARLRKYLEIFAADPTPQRGRDVGASRMLLAGYIAKRGRPDSETCRERRARQLGHASAATVQELSQVVAARLEAYPPRSGLSDPGAVTQPVDEREAARFHTPIGATIPETLQRKVERALVDTVDALVEREIITSGETLAKVLPQLTAGLRAASIEDETLRTLYAAIYRAFRRRRSLLLLNLESQVRIEELPWVQAIEAFRREDLSSAELARQALREIATLTITAFPQAILPNKLLQELVALAKTANLPLPLVEELAADIFMGEFGPKFLAAAKLAGELLEGSLYARYFAIDYDAIRRIPKEASDPTARARRGRHDVFAQLCAARAGVSLGTWEPATNGMVLEQQQIITTQNLAALFATLGLQESLRGRLDDMARRAFEWICDRLQIATDRWHAKLIAVKNAAYAWRQMIFFLSLLPEAEAMDFLAWADEHLDRQSPAFRERFGPALRGLILAAEGESLDGDSAKREQARRFLGWTNAGHWLLASPE